MNGNSITGQGNALRELRRLAEGRADIEQCEFCSLPLGPVHRHLLETATRKIVCVCDPCALAFENAIGRWKLIPPDARPLTDFQMTDAQWEALSVPINLAFFFHSTPAKKVMAMYPSPAGATESLLPLSSWEALVESNPSLTKMQADVEALLVKRLNGGPQYYIAPIDLCFALVGLIRMHWRGFSGGDRVWQEIESFFGAIKGLPACGPEDPSALRETKGEVRHA